MKALSIRLNKQITSTIEIKPVTHFRTDNALPVMQWKITGYELANIFLTTFIFFGICSIVLPP